MNSMQMQKDMTLEDEPPRSEGLQYATGEEWSTITPERMKRTSLGVLVLGLVGLHRTVQLQLLQHNWLGHRLGLL